MTSITIPEGAHLIGGEWITDGPAGSSFNPVNLATLGEYPLGDASTATAAVDARLA
jgi:hypothetical protein